MYGPVNVLRALVYVKMGLVVVAWTVLVDVIVVETVGETTEVETILLVV
jgi:hypothetical protein